MENHQIIDQIIQDHRAINRYIRQDDPEAWLNLNLTIGQVKSLFFIANQEKANFRMLAAALKVTPSNVTGIIDRLVDHQLVSRTENPADRRSLTLQLTPQGESVLNLLRERRVSQMSEMLNTLSNEQLQTISRGFQLLANVISTSGPKLG